MQTGMHVVYTPSEPDHSALTLQHMHRHCQAAALGPCHSTCEPHHTAQPGCVPPPGRLPPETSLH
jgi:hypothetical protein